MLRLKHLEELARVSRNFANMAKTEEERAELLRMAEEYERRADLRKRSIDASHGEQK